MLVRSGWSTARNALFLTLTACAAIGGSTAWSQASGGGLAVTSDGLFRRLGSRVWQCQVRAYEGGRVDSMVGDSLTSWRTSYPPALLCRRTTTPVGSSASHGTPTTPPDSLRMLIADSSGSVLVELASWWLFDASQVQPSVGAVQRELDALLGMSSDCRQASESTRSFEVFRIWRTRGGVVMMRLDRLDPSADPQRHSVAIIEVERHAGVASCREWVDAPSN